MKQILKDAEPPDFSEWKKDDPMAHRPRWNRVPTPIKKKVHDSLMREQGYICCYCEASVAMDDSHVEHFHPKEKYRNRQLDYINLHCSCQRELLAGEPRHCGYRKGSWFDKDLLISPLASDCEGRFRFTASGDIFPRHNDAAARVTIEKLSLDLPKLNALRAAAVDGLYDLSKTQISQLLARGKDGRFLEFHSTIKQVLTAG